MLDGVNVTAGCLGDSLDCSTLPLTVANTDGEICSVSVDFYIINGEYDTDLKWPFEGQIAVTLLNKQTDSLHHKKKIYYEGEYKSNEASQFRILKLKDLIKLS